MPLVLDEVPGKLMSECCLTFLQATVGGMHHVGPRKQRA